MTKILVVDDDPDMLAAIQAGLRRKDFDILTAREGNAALRLALRENPELVITDVMMPPPDGMEICRRLKRRIGTFTPVLLMTARGDLDHKLKGFRHGADDFLVKPFAMQELNARVASMLKIKRLHDDLRQASLTDPLTGLYNRRYLQERLPEECGRAMKGDYSFVSLMIDLDHFKRVNDRLGHPAGDQVLALFARTVRGLFRREDLLARYGGEEFVAVLSGASPEEGLARAERVREAVRATPFPGGSRGPLFITCSIGLCPFPHPRLRDAESLLQALDAALYRAKKEGRNRVYAADESIPPSST